MVQVERRSRQGVLLLILLQFACAESQADPPVDRLPERTVEQPALVVLGSAFGNPDQEFSRVVATELVGDSALLVVSAGTHDLRLFDLGGSLLRAYGREGDGPGENQGLRKIFRDGDTLWTFDVLLHRLDQWSLSDGYLRSVRMPLLAGSPVWTAFGVFADGAILGGMSPRSESMAAGTADTHLDLVRWIPGTNEAVALHTVNWNRLFTIIEENGSTGFRIPFSEDASVAVTGASYWYTDSRSATLQNYSANGELLRTVELPFALEPVSEYDRQAFEDVWLGSSEGRHRQRLQKVVDEATYPQTLPAVTDLVVASDGSLWAGRYVKAGQTNREWFVVSADGAVIERISLPADLTLRAVAEERIAGVRRAESGIEQVVVHRLSPSP